MQFKKFEGADMQEALRKVKEELGPDAVIFTTRTVKPNGLFGPAHVEVTAAVDPEAAAAPAKSYAAPKANENGLERRLVALRQELRSLRDDIGPREEEHFDHVQAQLDDLRRMLAHMSHHDGAPDWVRHVLEGSDLSPSLVRAIADDVRSRMQRDGAKARRDALYGSVFERLATHRYRHGQARIIAMVGPTGVGKTTTIAKIAAKARLAEGRNVVLIGLDNYRVGAVAQLEEYAELIGVPVRLTNGRAEFAQALAQHADADLILVDTAGRNPNDAEQVPALAEVFAAGGRDQLEVHLCMPAATRRRELSRMLDRYHALAPDALLFTKLDEAAELTALLNAADQSSVPLSWVTTGQRVPEDIEPAQANRLADRITDVLLTSSRESAVGQAAGLQHTLSNHAAIKLGAH